MSTYVDDVMKRAAFVTICAVCCERHHHYIKKYKSQIYTLECPSCGASFTFRPQTHEEKLAYNKRYNKTRPKTKRVYTDEQKARLKEYKHRYYIAHRQQTLDRVKRYTQDHKDKIKAYKKAYHYANRERENARRKENRLKAEKRKAEEERIRSTPTCTFERTHMGIGGNWFCKCSNCGSAGQNFDERVISRPYYAFCPTCGRRIVNKVVSDE